MSRILQRQSAFPGHAIATVFAVLAVAVNPWPAAAQTITRGPYLQQSTTSSIVVRWRTDIPTDSRVRYGSAVGMLTVTVDDANLVTEHEVTVSGLAASTRYFYSIGTTAGELAGNDANTFFYTHPPVGTVQPVRIWVIGDAGTGFVGQTAVRDRYYAFTGATHTDLWLQLGDNAYDNGTDAEFSARNFAIYADLYRKSVSWPCIGNHEGSGLAGYYPAFTLPTLGEAGGVASGTEAYYSFDFANIHFVVLDSYNSSRLPGGAMYNWLVSDLQATPQDFVIAYFHHPPYTKGSHNSDTEVELIDMRAAFVPLLESYGVDLVLTGHSHSYERSMFVDGHYGSSDTFDSGTHVVQSGSGFPVPYGKNFAPRDGAVYSVVGSSGKTSGGSLDHEVMEVSLNVLGSLVIDVNGGLLDARMIDDAGVVRDRFQISKSDAATPTQTALGSTSTPTLTATPLPGGAFTPIPTGAVWKYDDSDTDRLSPSPAYFDPAYDDSSWRSGAAPLGFGEAYIVTTTVRENPTAMTQYFRHSFEVLHDPGSITSLTLTAGFDDGFAAYINGQEVLRQGVAAMPVLHASPATNHEAGSSITYDVFDLTAHTDKLVLGSNILAVDVHQQNSGSSDLVWDAGLSYSLPFPTATATGTQTQTAPITPTATGTPVATSTATISATVTATATASVPVTDTPMATPTTGSGGASCDPTPRGSCNASGKASLKLRGGTTDPQRRQLGWKWLLGTADKADFGDPVGGPSSYALCVYEDGALISSAQLTADGFWRDLSAGYKYSNKLGNPDGISKVLMKAGIGRAKILVKGRGSGLAATLPAPGVAQVQVQLLSDAGGCWTSTFPAPPRTSTAEQYKHKIP